MRSNFWKALDHFHTDGGVENDLAYYRRRVPLVGSEAFLHIIYKPAPAEVVEQVSGLLGLPSDLLGFYRECNGATLFVTGIYVYGCLAAGQLLSRASVFSLLPFDIVRENQTLRPSLASRNFLAIGGYSHDGSKVCIDRDTNEVVCLVERDTARERKRWDSIKSWLGEELPRFAAYYTPDGYRTSGSPRSVPPPPDEPGSSDPK